MLSSRPMHNLLSDAGLRLPGTLQLSDRTPSSSIFHIRILLSCASSMQLLERQMDIASIEFIPQELLDNVLSFIPSCKDRSQLSQTSKITRARTIKGLFTTISLTWRSKGVLGESDTGSSPRIDLLLRTVLENPQYAPEIRTLELLGHGYDYPRRLPVLKISDTPKADLMQLAQLAIQQNEYANSEEWLEALDQCNLDAIIALLLLQCQNLSSLTLGSILLRSKSWTAYLPRVLAQSFLRSSSKPLLQHLRHFRLDGCGTDATSRTTRDLRSLARELDWRTYISFFNCQTLRELDVNLQDYMVQNGLSKLATRVQNDTLQCLRLHGSSITPATLADILKWTPNLVDLTYNHCFRHPLPLGVKDVRTALLPLRNTLKTFVFTPQLVKCGCASVSDVCIVGHCSLVDFTTLESVCAPPWALLGWTTKRAPPLESVLPRSLQHLDLTDTFVSWPSYQWRQVELYDVFAQSWNGKTAGSSTVPVNGISFMNDDETCWFDRITEEAMKDLSRHHGLTCDIFKVRN